MRVETQLAAFLENKAGVLADLAEDLAQHGINIRALTVSNLVDHALVRLVVSEPRKAIHLLGERGVLVVASEVLSIDMPDQAGALAAVADKLGRAGVNIDYAYGSCARGTGLAPVYLHVSNLRAAQKALAGGVTNARRRATKPRRRAR